MLKLSWYVVIGAYNLLTQEIGSRYFWEWEFAMFLFHENMWEMIQVHVALPSGKRKILIIDESSKVGDLKILAQQAFGQGFLRLVTAAGFVLNDPAKSLQDARVQDGDHLTAVVQQAKLASTERAFALWCCGGDRLLTWGDPGFGGDSSAVQHKLKKVQNVMATVSAFAAILFDGSVVTWGDPEDGGDSSAVQHQLKDVQQVQANCFACICCDFGWWISSDMGRSTFWW